MSLKFEFTEHSHKRFNPLTRSSILVSPHRAKRPWLGQTETPQQDSRPHYDPKCYLCPGNTRVDGTARNPAYDSTFMFKNDFAALQSQLPEDVDHQEQQYSELFQYTPMKGECRVLCFHPDHSLTIAKMTLQQINIIVQAWISLYHSYRFDQEFSAIGYVQIFENKGEMMGCSNPHPHGQVWALETVPEEPLREYYSMKIYQNKHDRCMLCDYVTAEVGKAVRVVFQNELFIVVVPFWATWPFETMILSKEHLRSFEDFEEKHSLALAECISVLTCKYDNMFQCSFPYSSGIHQAPIVRNGNTAELPELHEQSAVPSQWMHSVSHWHMHFYPPLLRSASVRKFLVGFEMLGMPQRDLTAEQAADRLRNLDGSVHYSRNNNKQ